MSQGLSAAKMASMRGKTLCVTGAVAGALQCGEHQGLDAVCRRGSPRLGVDDHLRGEAAVEAVARRQHEGLGGAVLQVDALVAVFEQEVQLAENPRDVTAVDLVDNEDFMVAGRSMPGMVCRWKRAIAISAPVLPAGKP